MATLISAVVVLGLSCAEERRSGFGHAEGDGRGPDASLGSFVLDDGGRPRAHPRICRCDDEDLGVTLAEGSEVTTLTMGNSTPCPTSEGLFCGVPAVATVTNIVACAGRNAAGLCIDLRPPIGSIVQTDGAVWDLGDASIQSDAARFGEPSAWSGAFAATATPRDCDGGAVCQSVPVAGSFRVCGHYESIPCE